MRWTQKILASNYLNLLLLSIAVVLAFMLKAIFLSGNKPIERGAYYLKTANSEIEVQLEVAKTPKELMKGLSEVNYLPKHAGMLFVFDSPQKLSFWMKDTKLPLDLLYLDEEMIVREIYENLEPYSLLPVLSRLRYSYALEFNAGFVRYYGVSKGDRLFQVKSK